ncbi:MAG: flagellar hook-associated protein FlgL [Bdellovibrionales bacterium]|nr:flagellar hook-associated protein FlgL [Bdellovibrionales bacterium]
MNFEQVNTNLRKNRSSLSELQNQAATQKRVTKPSDDPIAAQRVLGARIDLTGAEQFDKSLNYAKSFLDFTDQSLGELTDILVRAKELAISQANDASASSQSRRITAREISQGYDQMVQIGNRKLGERFIFGGFKTQAAPFTNAGIYSGDDGEMQIQIDKQAFLPMNIPGAKVFLGEGHGALGVTKGTPEQANTIEKFIEDEKRTARRERQGKGTAPTGVDNSETVKTRGPASTKDFTNPGQFDPAKNTALRPDQAEGENLFSTIEKLYVSLNTNDKTGIQNAIEDLDRAVSQVVMARAQVGARSMALNSARTSLGKSKVDHAAIISELEDVDVFKTVSDINKTETTLKATLQTSGKLIQPSLLDFLR